MIPALKTAEFIARAIAVHGQRYDYSAVDNPPLDDWVMLMCAFHGPFHIIASDHLAGNGCEVCVVKAKQRALRGR